ncbi:hypothetical protein CVT26_005781 [Gymnopilus dilepis]|uniref:Uncharacterized protein n=1 Tax=Gymnopilus dilepis TaxID=231916 RepID=A0A409VPQ2_9AGAR|nr:hypothetical protein CVT26_005781 [Gymnopilus dilepis]
MVADYKLTADIVNRAIFLRTIYLRLLHPLALKFMDPLSQGATVAALPVAAIPAAVQLFQNPALDKWLRPQARIDKWTKRVDEVMRQVLAQREYVPIVALESFLELFKTYLVVRRTYQSMIAQGCSSWKGEARARGNEFATTSRLTVEQGWSVSQQASYTEGSCYIAHRNVPKNAAGQCSKCFPDHVDYNTLADPNADQAGLEIAIVGWIDVIRALKTELPSRRAAAEQQSARAGPSDSESDNGQGGSNSIDPVTQSAFPPKQTSSEMESSLPSTTLPRLSCESTSRPPSYSHSTSDTIEGSDPLELLAAQVRNMWNNVEGLVVRR